MIGFFVQLIVPLALMFYRFPRKRHFWWLLVPQLVVELVISFFYFTPTSASFMTEGVSIFLYYLLCYLFAFLLVFIPFRLNVFKTLFYYTAAMLVQNFGHHTYGLIMRLAGIGLENQYDKFYYLLILAAIYAVVYAVFYLVILRKLKIEDLERMPKVSTLLVSASFLIVMIVLGIYIRHFNSPILEGRGVGIVYELYSSILVFMILCIQFGIFRAAKLEEGNRDLQMRLDAESRYYDMARKNMERINIISHDLKHRLAELRRENAHGSKEELEDLESQVASYDTLVDSGNEALDYLLTEKMRLCQRNHIDFSMMVDGKLLSGLSYGDLCSLFGNAIDNAIEAELREEEGKRRIYLRTSRVRDMVFVHVENLCSKEPTFEKGLPRTTKTEPGHGYGTKSMLYIAEKYGGHAAFFYKNGLYNVDIFLPLGANPARKDTENA